MIAMACIETGLAPESFGVPASEEIGAAMLSILEERWAQREMDALKNRLV